jgi:hypothetical protein
VNSHIKKVILSVSLVSSLLGCFKFKAQEISTKDLYGFWKVKDLLYLQMIGNETEDDYKDRMKIYHECLKAKIKIGSSGIEVLPGAGQNKLLEVCDSNLFTCQFLEKKIILSNGSNIYDDGSEMIDSNVIGTGFIKRLDKNFSGPTLTLMDTNCKQGFGNYTLKICIVNKNKIGLYTGANLIILERLGID